MRVFGKWLVPLSSDCPQLEEGDKKVVPRGNGLIAG